MSKCIGGGASAANIIATGTVDGTNVNLTISFPANSGTRTVTMVGVISGPASGAYTDSLSDSGTWTASIPYSFNAQYTGSYNSTTHSLSITPSILFALKQADNFTLTGNATVTHSPYISTLTLTGQAIGGVFVLTDAANKAQIFAVPAPHSFLTLNFAVPSHPTRPGAPATLAPGRSPLTTASPTRSPASAQCAYRSSSCSSNAPALLRTPHTRRPSPRRNP